MTGASDETLVARIRETRDENAFRELYERHGPMLYRLAVRLLHDRNGCAEDLVHDTWLRATERWHAFTWRSTLRTWLTGILVNCIRETRREWRRSPSESMSHDFPDAVPELDLRLDLETAIAALPLGYRSVLILHDVEGFRHAEIARILDIETGTSKSQLARARLALRKWLEPGSQERPDG